LYFSDALLAYDFGPGHPMAPHRVRLTLDLAAELGVLDQLDVVEPSVPSEQLLLGVHSPRYIAAVQAASADPSAADDALRARHPGQPGLPRHARIEPGDPRPRAWTARWRSTGATHCTRST